MEEIRSVRIQKLVILNGTEVGVKDLLYLPFDIGAGRRSTKHQNCAFSTQISERGSALLGRSVRRHP
jgi:hypothetical protein